MSYKSNRFILFLFYINLLFFIVGCTEGREEKVSVIFCIGDGMGFEHVKATNYFLTGEDKGVSFVGFPVTGSLSTYCADDEITDSAASATAFATGAKVNRGVVSRRIPGDGSNLVTLLELFDRKGAATGIVTTSAVTHATPAAFTAHTDTRGNYSDISNQLLNVTKPNIILGGGGPVYYVNNILADNAGYAVVSTRNELFAYSGEDPICGIFSDDHMPYEYDGYGDKPHLSEMVEKSLDILGRSDQFFLLVECARIDHASHGSNIELMIPEVIEFSNTVNTIVQWIKSTNHNVVLIVTADHETGGLEMIQGNGIGNIPDVRWTSNGSHTGVNVPYYIYGRNSLMFSSVRDNTHFFTILEDMINN